MFAHVVFIKLIFLSSIEYNLVHARSESQETICVTTETSEDTNLPPSKNDSALISQTEKNKYVLPETEISKTPGLKEDLIASNKLREDNNNSNLDISAAYEENGKNHSAVTIVKDKAYINGLKDIKSTVRNITFNFQSIQKLTNIHVKGHDSTERISKIDRQIDPSVILHDKNNSIRNISDSVERMAREKKLEKVLKDPYKQYLTNNVDRSSPYMELETAVEATSTRTYSGLLEKEAMSTLHEALVFLRNKESDKEEEKVSGKGDARSWNQLTEEANESHKRSNSNLTTKQSNLNYVSSDKDNIKTNKLNATGMGTKKWKCEEYLNKKLGHIFLPNNCRYLLEDQSHQANNAQIRTPEKDRSTCKNSKMLKPELLVLSDPCSLVSSKLLGNENKKFPENIDSSILRTGAHKRHKRSNTKQGNQNIIRRERRHAFSRYETPYMPIEFNNGINNPNSFGINYAQYEASNNLPYQPHITKHSNGYSYNKVEDNPIENVNFLFSRYNPSITRDKRGRKNL